MEDDKNWSARWSKKKLTYPWMFWVLIAVVALMLAVPLWFQFFPPVSP